MKVTQLNLIAKNLLEENLANIELEGEITKFIAHSSGHWYFTLKDEYSSISCCMFKGSNFSVDFAPKDTNYVKLIGKISLWEVSGRYQFIANSMKKIEDIGELEKKFLLLKEKLQKAGYFDEKYKKPLPYLPKKIAIISSFSGAVITDMLEVLKRDEYFLSKIFLYDCLMQGDKSPKEIKAILEQIDNLGYDVIIIARGGGSREDLFCFNDEELANTIFNAKTPIVSAIGHGTDVNIIDYVADFFVQTPTAAMSLFSISKKRLQNTLDDMQKQLKNQVQINLSNIKNRFLNLQKNFNILFLNQKISQKENYLNFIYSNLKNSVYSKLQTTQITLNTKMELFKSVKNYLLLNKDNVNIFKDNKKVALNEIKNDDILNLIGQNYKIKAKVLEIIKE